jgi:hypothetical protein
VDVVRQLLVVLHIVGIGALLGGFLTQMKGMKTGDVRITPAVTHGALTMFVTGLALVAVRKSSALDLPVDNAKIGTKMAVLVVILLLAWANRGKDKVDTRVFGAIGLLTIANIAIAVMWT